MRVRTGQQTYGAPGLSYTNYPGYNAGLPYGAASAEIYGTPVANIANAWPWWNYGWVRPWWAGPTWYPPVNPYTWYHPRYAYVYAGRGSTNSGCGCGR